MQATVQIELTKWNELKELMDSGFDLSNNDEWENFTTIFINSLSQLFITDRQLIECCISKNERYRGSPHRFMTYFSTYDEIQSAAIESVRETLASLKSQPEGRNTGALPSREFFYSELQASHLASEIPMLNQVIFSSEPNESDQIEDDTKFDIAKEATDSVKSFIKRMFRFVPKIESTLATINEMLSIGRKLF